MLILADLPDAWALLSEAAGLVDREPWWPYFWAVKGALRRRLFEDRSGVLWVHVPSLLRVAEVFDRNWPGITWEEVYPPETGVAPFLGEAVDRRLHGVFAREPMVDVDRVARVDPAAVYSAGAAGVLVGVGSSRVRTAAVRGMIPARFDARERPSVLGADLLAWYRAFTADRHRRWSQETPKSVQAAMRMVEVA